MNNEERGLITVQVTERRELKADHVDFVVTVRGSSLFTGDEALKKAREVSQLVSQLTALGIPESQIFVENIRVEVASGLISRTSSAFYHLRIRCLTLETVPDVLGILTSQKNLQMNSMAWGYPDERDIQNDLLDQCLASADAKARRIASGLGVQLLGVFTFDEGNRFHDMGGITEHIDFDFAAQAPARAKRMGDELKLTVSHSKSVEMRIEVKYRVGGFEPSPIPELRLA